MKGAGAVSHTTETIYGVSLPTPTRPVDVREGFDAQVTGRFNNARLTITAVDGASDGEFDATLNAHGVELKVPFKVSGIAAIDDVASDATYEVTGIYTVDGRMLQTVSVASLPAGIYVVRYANGKAAKINDPAVNPHYWRYRMHLTIEDLLEENLFNQRVISLIATSGR